MAPRRTRTRQPSSDGIEEQAVTQRSRASRAREDVSDDNNSSAEETQQRQRQRTSTAKSSRARVSKANTSARASTSRRKAAAAEPSGSEDEDDMTTRSLQIDVANFTDQPIPRGEGRKVALLAGDWEMVVRNMKTMALSLAVDAGVGMAEAGLGKDEDAAARELEKIEKTMRQLLDTQAELKSHQATLEDLTNRIATGEEISDIVNQYDKGVQERLKTWASKTSRQKYAKDEKYIDFKTRVYEVQHPDDPMPPLTELIPKEDGDESDDNDDIEIGGVTQDYKCMLTLQTLVDPMRSSKCNHFFSGAAIREYLGNNRSSVKKCPATGCSAMVGLADLKPDKELEKKVKAHNRRRLAREAETNSDDEDEDEEVL